MTGMPYPDFLNAIIDDGENEVRERFAAKPHQYLRKDGALEGFRICRGKAPEELAAALDEARARRETAQRTRAPDYWFWRERENQIEWVMGVMSAAFYSNGHPAFTDIYASHVRKAAMILE
jgi:hypothetical protein